MNSATWNTIEAVFRDLLIFVGAMVALLVVLIIVVSMLSSSNPLKRILTALSYRVGATAALGALAVPIEPIPGLDVAYDIGAPVFLLWFWYKFFKNMGPMWRDAPGPRQISS